MIKTKSAPGRAGQGTKLGSKTPVTGELEQLRKKVAELEALEQQNREAMTALEESERRFRAVFENSAGGILMTDHDGRIVTANGPAGRILGSIELVRGRKLSTLAPHAARLLSPRFARGQHRMEIEGPDGRKRLLSFSNEPVALPGGKGAITFFTDVSQVFWAEERKRRAEQLAYVGELAARLSHEIKNPLATIQAGLKVMHRDLAGDARNQETLSIVVKEMESIAVMITGLLGAARNEPFRADLADLGPLLDESLALFFGAARAKGRTLTLAAPPTALEVTVDRKAFGRALGNLVHNSMEATGAGGRIEIEARELEGAELSDRFPGFKGRAAVVVVRDDGPGVTAELAKKIFEPFYTTKKSGTGLGLAVARDIVDAHGGVLAVGGGRGGRFEILLPLCRRAPCWEWVVYHEWEIYYGEDRCEGCGVRREGSGQLCWTRKLAEADQDNPDLAARCLHCPVYQAGNLGHYYRTGA